MCSDMPMEDMAEDINFGKKWMFMILFFYHLMPYQELKHPNNQFQHPLEYHKIILILLHLYFQIFA